MGGYLSVDKSGNPDGSQNAFGNPSEGWSWFPGYAIDLDQGRRINIVIAETQDEGAIGDDLLWNPDESENAARHFVILTNIPYDFGPNGEPGSFEQEFDSLFLDSSTASRIL